MLIFRFIIFCYHYNSFTCFSAQKSSDFSYCPVVQNYIPPLYETLCFSSCLFKVPLLQNYPVFTDWSAQQLSNLNSYVTNQSRGIHDAHVWLCDIVWCHKVTKLKAGLLTRRFRSSVFCGRGELHLLRTSPFFLNFQDLLHAQKAL